jgi:hypothetical protein
MRLQTKIVRYGLSVLAALAVTTAVAATATSGLVSWNTLAMVKEAVTTRGKTVDFSSTLAALDKKPVVVRGFRIPLEVKTHFLLASKPSDCEFCIEGGPESYIEVFTKDPFTPTFGRPVTVSGTLHLLKNDPSGIYYRLMDAKLVSVD